MWVMVLSALAPTVAQAMVAVAEKGQWVEVCSASGMVWLKADGTDAANDSAPVQGQSVADMGKHCPWCSFHGAVAGLPPPVTSAPLLVDLTQALTAPAPLAWIHKPPRSTQARAPPAAS